MSLLVRPRKASKLPVPQVQSERLLFASEQFTALSTLHSGSEHIRVRTMQVFKPPAVQVASECLPTRLKNAFKLPDVLSQIRASTALYPSTTLSSSLLNVAHMSRPLMIQNSNYHYAYQMIVFRHHLHSYRLHGPVLSSILRLTCASRAKMHASHCACRLKWIRVFFHIVFRFTF